MRAQGARQGVNRGRLALGMDLEVPFPAHRTHPVNPSSEARRSVSCAS